MGEIHGDMNWEGLGFSLTPTDYMHVMKCSKGDKFSQGSIVRYGNIEISPAAGILNYGQVRFVHIFCLLKFPFKIVLKNARYGCRDQGPRNGCCGLQFKIMVFSTSLFLILICLLQKKK